MPEIRDTATITITPQTSRMLAAVVAGGTAVYELIAEHVQALVDALAEFGRVIAETVQQIIPALVDLGEALARDARPSWPGVSAVFERRGRRR